jgi:tight adherence protein C
MSDYIDLFVDPVFLVTVLASISAFATVLTVTMPLLARDRVQQRMKVMAVERGKMRAVRMAEMAAKERAGTKLRQKPKGIVQRIADQLDLRSKFDSEELRMKMKMAGLRSQAHLVTFMVFRIAMPIVTFVAALVYLFLLTNFAYPPVVKFLVALGAGYLGFYLPNIYIQNLATKRQTAIKLAFPDALDMLLICVQSGMSVEAAFAKVANEVTSQSIELAEELSLTTAELSYLPDRRQAFENLGKRTGLPGVKAVATALIQAERYGTPVGQALRVMAKENRDIRMSEAEQKAAALPPKLTVPMIVFFLPVLFLAILGPAVLRYMKLAV